MLICVQMFAATRQEQRADPVFFLGQVVVAVVVDLFLSELGVQSSVVAFEVVDAGGDDFQALEVGRDLGVELFRREVDERGR